MRKLEYFRNAMKKCKTMDDVKRIELPREFKSSKDGDGYPKMSVDLVKDDDIVYMMFTITHNQPVMSSIKGVEMTGLSRESHEWYYIPISKKFSLKSYIEYEKLEFARNSHRSISWRILSWWPSSSLIIPDFITNIADEVYSDEEVEKAMKFWTDSKNLR